MCGSLAVSVLPVRVCVSLVCGRPSVSLSVRGPTPTLVSNRCLDCALTSLCLTRGSAAPWQATRERSSPPPPPPPPPPAPPPSRLASGASLDEPTSTPRDIVLGAGPNTGICLQLSANVFNSRQLSAALGKSRQISANLDQSRSSPSRDESSEPRQISANLGKSRSISLLPLESRVQRTSANLGKSRQISINLAPPPRETSPGPPRESPRGAAAWSPAGMS